MKRKKEMPVRRIPVGVAGLATLLAIALCFLASVRMVIKARRDGNY